MQIGDRVKVTVKDGYFVTMGIRERYGNVYHINKHLITVQFDNYRESFMKTDLLARGWVDMMLKQGKEWIKVDKKVMN